MGAEKESALEGHGEDGTVAAGQCGLPCFTGGREKGNSFYPKRGKMFLPGAKKSGMTPFPQGGNRAKIGGKTEMRETFL